MASARRPQLSLRNLAMVFTILFGTLVVALAAGLTWASALVWRSAQATARQTEEIILTSEIDRTLRDYQRLGNLFVTTRDPEIDAMRSLRKADLRRMLAQMREHVEGATERQLLAGLSDQVEKYSAERRTLEARMLSLEQLVRAVRPSFEDALTSSASLRGYNEMILQNAQRRAGNVIRLERLLAIGLTGALIIGLGIVVIGMRWAVLLPVFELQDAMRRFRSGDAEAKAREGRLREMRELASTFNEMADAITHQRRDQLTFLAGVAHDLRNPLSTLKIAVTALARDSRSITPEWTQRMDRQIDWLARMVGDLLDATRIEAGELELHLQDMDLCDTARAVVALYPPTAITHEVILSTPEYPVVVRGDSLRIEQVINNLVSNAIKYSPGRRQVEVVVSAVEGEAKLDVIDQGVGIPEEELENVFLPFRRRRATAEIVPGAGLGLSIVRRIVVAHGGRAEVESRPGIGSTFRIRLPLVEALGTKCDGRSNMPERKS